MNKIKIIPGIMFCLTCFLLSVLTLLISSCSPMNYASEEPVGKIGLQTYITPVHQILTPTGVQVNLPGMRPQAIALSPDGRLLATSGKTHELILIDPEKGDIKQRSAVVWGLEKIGTKKALQALERK